MPVNQCEGWEREWMNEHPDPGESPWRVVLRVYVERNERGVGLEDFRPDVTIAAQSGATMTGFGLMSKTSD